jgi:transcriptional regulator with XRE-family HTH domain
MLLNIDKFYQEIGSIIKELREKQGVSQEALANYLGLTRMSIINLEKGRHRPSIHQIFLIADLLKVNIHELLPISKIGLSNEIKKIKVNGIISADTLKKESLNSVNSFLASI